MAPSLQVASRAAQALHGCSIPALRNLSVEETDHEVVLSGTVCCYYFKQLAQEMVMPFLENRSLSNQVRVVRP